MVYFFSGRDPKTIERCNLLNVSKLIIKEVIDSSLSHGRMLDDNHVPLQQFFIVLEHVLRHGLKRMFYAHVFQKRCKCILIYILKTIFQSIFGRNRHRTYILLQLRKVCSVTGETFGAFLKRWRD